MSENPIKWLIGFMDDPFFTPKDFKEIGKLRTQRNSNP